MATSTSPNQTTDPTRRGPEGWTVIGAVVGVLGVIAGFIPGLFFVAWLLGVVAIAIGLPVLRRGKSSPGHAVARVAVFAGAAALVIGVINLGIVLDWFTYFTTDETLTPGVLR